VLAREGAAGDKRLVAYYTTMGAELEAQQIRAQLSEVLPGYMVPAAYVRLERFPLTPNGKLDRKALPDPGAEAFAGRGYESPQGEVEEKLAQTWAQLLKVKRVGRNDNFFELGGHSLLAVQLVSVLKREGIDISLSQIFVFPTIQDLANEYLNKRNFKQLGIVPLRTDGDGFPLFLVHEGGGEVMSWGPQILRHIDEKIPVYGLIAEHPAELSLRTLEGMATRLIRAIHTIQPKGPYSVAGWSFGGILAYEIATQLLGNDEEVQFLGLFDPVYDVIKSENDANKIVNSASWSDTTILKQIILEKSQNPAPTIQGFSGSTLLGKKKIH
jgi:aryl carrier-like protein